MNIVTTPMNYSQLKARALRLGIDAAVRGMTQNDNPYSGVYEALAGEWTKGFNQVRMANSLISRFSSTVGRKEVVPITDLDEV